MIMTCTFTSIANLKSYLKGHSDALKLFNEYMLRSGAESLELDSLLPVQDPFIAAI